MLHLHGKNTTLALSLGLAVAGFSGPMLLGQSGNLAFATETRAQALFRNYCMDCHGPKLTGESFDKTLLCPNVQGKDVDKYQDAIQSGPDVMPKFQVSPSYVSDGNLLLSYDDFLLLSNHEATFTSTQP